MKYLNIFVGSLLLPVGVVTLFVDKPMNTQTVSIIFIGVGILLYANFLQDFTKGKRQ